MSFVKPDTCKTYSAAVTIGDIIGKDRNTVVHAVADGKLAAINIHKHLSSRGENIG